MLMPLIPRQSPLADPGAARAALAAHGVNPWVAACLASRGVQDPAIALGEYRLLPYAGEKGLRGIDEMAKKLVAAIVNGEKIVVAADYDCDGATACSVAVSGLRSLGADIDFVVPNRFVHGYGLTPSVVEVIAELKPRHILTVDNGIASHAGVDAANALGINVLVTDHHLPASGLPLPKAAAIVNPNQDHCPFPSKNLAGVGVMFYVVAATRAELKRQGHLYQEFDVSSLLDLVALGTVADVVRLDDNNRWLVNQGLIRIRQGLVRPGISALFAIANKDPERATAQDFGFGLGPRINAAGRLDDMSIGIRCLLAETHAEALHLAYELDRLNKERKNIENDMKEVAWETIDLEHQRDNFTRVVYAPNFHEGVVGIVAGRIKEQEHTPVVVFAPATEEGLIKGSGRSIPGVHLRDALDVVHKRNPGLLVKFGGHAMAAGVTMHEESYPLFVTEFEKSVREFQDGKRIQKVLEVDGPLPVGELHEGTADAILAQVWGQGFEEPTWVGEFDVLESRLIGAEKGHLKMMIGAEGFVWEALQFFCDELPKSGRVRLAYRLSINEFRGERNIQVMVVDRADL